MKEMETTAFEEYLGFSIMKYKVLSNMNKPIDF